MTTGCDRDLGVRWRRGAGGGRGGRWAGAGDAALSARTDPSVTVAVGVCPHSLPRGPNPPERAGSEAVPGPKARGVLRSPGRGGPAGAVPGSAPALLLCPHPGLGLLR